MKFKRFLVGLLTASMTLGSFTMPAYADEPSGDPGLEAPIPDGEVPEDPSPGGEVPDDPAPDGELPDNPAPDGELPDNPAPDGELPDNPAPDGELPDNPAPDGELPSDPAPDGELPNDPTPDGDLPGGELPGNEDPGTNPGGTIIPLEKYNMTLHLNDDSLTVIIEESFPVDAASVNAKVDEVRATVEAATALNYDANTEYEVTSVTITNDGNTVDVNDFDYASELKEGITIDAYLSAILAPEPEPLPENYDIVFYTEDSNFKVTIEEQFPASYEDTKAKVEASLTDEVKDAFEITDETKYEIGRISIADSANEVLAEEYDYTVAATEETYVKAELVIEKEVKVPYAVTIKVYDPDQYDKGYEPELDELPTATFNFEEVFFKAAGEVNQFVTKYLLEEEVIKALDLNTKTRYKINSLSIINNEVEVAAADFDFTSELFSDLEVVAVVQPRALMGATPKFNPEYIDDVVYVPVTMYDYSEDRNDANHFTFKQNGTGDANSYTGGHSPRFGLAADDITGGNFKLANGMTLTNNNGGGQPFQGGSGYGFPFVVDGDGNYFFDSENYFVTTKDTDGNNMKLYAKPGYLKDGNNWIKGFMPFNKVSENRSDGYGITEDNNYFFGMSLETGFVMPIGGKTSGGQDMIFNFTGDDDVWVYIDDKLVLDIGGVHQSVEGTINFATGIVTVNGSQTGTINLSDNTKHTMRFYYLERGAGESNCRIKFNLQELYVPATYIYNEVHHYLNTRTNENHNYNALSLSYQEQEFEPVPLPTYENVTYKLVDVKVNGVSDVRDSYYFHNENINIDFYYEITDYTFQEIHEYNNKEVPSESGTITGDVEVYGANDTKTSKPVPKKGNYTYTLKSVTKNGEPISIQDSYSFTGKEDGNVVIKYYYEYELPSYTFEEDHYYTNLDDGSTGMIDGAPESYKGYRASDSKKTYNGKTYVLVEVKLNGAKLRPNDHYTFYAQEDGDVHMEYYYEYESPKYTFEEDHIYTNLDDSSKSGMIDGAAEEYKFDKHSEQKLEYGNLTYVLKEVKINDVTVDPMKTSYDFNGQVDKNIHIVYYYEYDLPSYTFEEDHYYTNLDDGSTGMIDGAPEQYKKYKTSEAKKEYNGKTYTLVKVTKNGGKLITNNRYTFYAQADGDIHMEYYYEYESPKYTFEEDHIYTNLDDSSKSGMIDGAAEEYKFDKHSEAKPNYDGLGYKLVRVEVNEIAQDPMKSAYDFNGQVDNNVHIVYYYEFESPKFTFEEDHYYKNFDDDALSGMLDGKPFEYKFDQNSSEKPDYNGTTYVLKEVKVNGVVVNPMKTSYVFNGQKDNNIHIEYFYEFESPIYEFREIHVYDHLDDDALDGMTDTDVIKYKFDMDSKAINVYKGVAFKLVEVEINKVSQDPMETSYSFNGQVDHDVTIKYYYKASYPRYKFEEDHFYEDLDDGAKHAIDNEAVEYFSAKTSKAITLCEDGQVYKLVKVVINGKEETTPLDEYTFDPINKGDKDVHIEYYYQYESEDLNVKSFHHYEFDKGELGVDKNTVNGIDKTFRKSYAYSEETKPVYDGRTYELSYVTVNGEKITADFKTLTEYKETFKANAVIDYYYTLKADVHYGQVKHLYINEANGSKIMLLEDKDIFIDSIEREVEAKPVNEGITYKLTAVTVDGAPYGFVGDKETMMFTDDFEVILEYHYYGPDLVGTVTHIYYDKTSKKDGFIMTRSKTFKLVDSFTEKQLTSYGGKDDYKLVYVRVNGVDQELKESYDFTMKSNYSIVFYYERKDKEVPPTPPITPDPKPEPTPPEPPVPPQPPVQPPVQIPVQPGAKLPQTGGILASFWIPVVGGIAVIGVGLGILFGLKKKKEDEENEED